MSRPNAALVIGGGIGGMCVAIALRKIGYSVELVEMDPQWRVYGAGVSLSGPTLRAFAQLGLLAEIEKAGYVSDDIGIFDVAGSQLSSLATPPPPDADVPGNAGIMRPALREVLARATLAVEVRVRLGATVSRLVQDEQSVHVEFSDGARGSYDLAVGADGLMSPTRQLLFPDAPQPAYTGQGAWRAVFARPTHITQARFYVGLPFKVGLNPVSDSSMYLFLLENHPTKRRVADAAALGEFRQLMAQCGGVLKQMSEELNAESQILFRPLEALLMPKPWHRGRVVLIGDAAHATTPHLASGAGMAVEDAVVLSQELQRASLAPALDAFTQRRYERCRMIVDNSVRLGEIEQGRGSEAGYMQLTMDSLRALAAPI